jgi:nucleotide-binding universal stress UspA family protein
MAVFDRVVVGVDGTDLGYEALHQALALIPPSAAVHAVTAVDMGIAVHAGFDMSRVSVQLEEEAEKARVAAAEIMEGRPSCTAKIVRGDAKVVLRAACSEHDATLVALGGRGSSRFLGIMAGETASTLLHEARQSVLLARVQVAQRWQPKQVVVGVDGSESSLAALSVADDLVDRLGSAIQVVAASGGKAVDREGAWAERVNEWDPRHPFAALHDRSRAADLVVIGSRGLHGLRALGSVSERVAHRAHCSTLVVHF